MQEKSLKWYKVLMYGLLYFVAIYNILQAVGLFTGYLSPIHANLVENNGATLNFYDMGVTLVKIVINSAFLSFDYQFGTFEIGFEAIAFGVYHILAAVLVVYVRYLLSKHKSKGPTMFTVMYAFSIIFGIAINLVINNTDLFFKFIIAVLAQMLIIKLHSSYFNKRVDQFDEY